MIKDKVLKLVNKIGVYFFAILLMIVGIIISRDFLSYSNLLNVIRSITFLGIATLGLSFVTYSGNIVDLSIPGIMAISGVVTILALPFGIFIAIIIGIIAGMIIGFINGLVIGYLKVNSIIWTLAMSYVLIGSIKWVLRFIGSQVYPTTDNISSSTSEFFVNLSRVTIFRYLPLTAIVLVIMIIIGFFIWNNTKFGLQLKLVGSSKIVAQMSGVNVKKITAIIFVISSFTASIAGIFLSSLLKMGTYSTGEGYEFDALTAVVIGGVFISGGRGTLIGAVGGVLSIGLLNNILTLLGVDTIAQQVAKGVLFIVIVGISSYFLRRTGEEFE
jgi:ribose/xylose/arabinose/galactoside ABC-type transport system permease subunit